MLESRTISISIDRHWQSIYEAIWRPEAFPKWASGLSKSSLIKDGDAWKAEGSEGSIRISFTDHNPFGVMDHFVTLNSGSTIYIPLRVICNGEGAEVALTLFRQPDMTDSQFETDAEWVMRDLLALKALVTC